MTITWFGLLTGGLELGLVLFQKALDPRVTHDMLRTNRHLVWMVPVSNVLIFAAIGLALVPLAWLRPKLAQGIALRLAVALGFSALFLSIQGLYPIAGVILGCGFASILGPWLGCRTVGFARAVRVSFPIMALCLAAWTGLNYERVMSAERRALSLCPPAKPGAPNVLLIVLDNVRAASLSLYGYDRPTTPHLQRWARRGVVFSEARSTASWTLPSHASLFTSRWPHELSTGADMPLDGTFPTLAEVLGREGYTTAGFVANPFYCNVLYGLNRGFAHYEDVYENQTVSLFEIVWSSSLGRRVLQALGYPTRVADGFTWVRKSAEMLNRDVLGWFTKRPSSQPYFIFLNYYDAHSLFLPPDGPDPHFGLGALPYAERCEIDSKFLELKGKKPIPDDAATEQVVNEALDLYRDSYESCIAYLDHQVGLLLDELERRGALENTLVIVTSDHGEHFGEHGLVGHGLSLYRAEVHVPLLVIPPSRSSRSSTAGIVNDPVSLREVSATVAEWTGLGPRSPFFGRSLTRFLDDGTEPLPEASPVLCEIQHMKGLAREDKVPASLGPLNSLVSRRHVYIRNGDGREELYELANDPFESDDLAKLPESRPDMDRFRETLSRLRRDRTVRAR